MLAQTGRSITASALAAHRRDAEQCATACTILLCRWQAESVAELVSARTGAAADSALAGLSGGLAETITAFRAEVIDLLAEIEARLDFDEDLPPLDPADVRGRLLRLAQQVSSWVPSQQKQQANATSRVLQRPEQSFACSKCVLG